MLSVLLTDFYKIGHVFQYPKGTEYVYSNLTARKSRIKDVDEVVFFGLQYFALKYLVDDFNNNFFNMPKEEVIKQYKRIVKNCIGALPTYEHIEKLHDLGYLPIHIKALEEGTVVPIRVPFLSIINTKPEFFWLTNFIESLMSAIIWQPITSATIAREYKKIFTKVLTDSAKDQLGFVNFMGHDFSFRGMGGLESAVISGMGHLTSFYGTDTIPAILALEDYYNADVEKELVGCSVAATEHSVMSSGTAIHGEFETFRELIQDIYPSGIVSIVSDTFDLWEVLTDFMPRLKDVIESREGKVVIRPDSGNPCDIICGTNSNIRHFMTNEDANDFLIDLQYQNDKQLFNINNVYYEVLSDNISDFIKDYNYDIYSQIRTNVDELLQNDLIRVVEYKEHPSNKGVVELLWDVFGGTINEQGFKVLNPKVGAIYGDSITIDRAKEISARLMAKGFAPIIVYGIGSYTYQYVTRDIFGMAVKCTAIVHDGEVVEVFKDPVTDDGTKKSLKGLIKVYEENGVIKAKDQCTVEEEKEGLLQTVFLDGFLVKETSLSEIRRRLNEN